MYLHWNDFSVVFRTAADVDFLTITCGCAQNDLLKSTIRRTRWNDRGMTRIPQTTGDRYKKIDTAQTKIDPLASSKIREGGSNVHSMEIEKYSTVIFFSRLLFLFPLAFFDLSSSSVTAYVSMNTCAFDCCC